MSANSMDLETQLIERIVERRNTVLERAKEKATTIIESAEQQVEKINTETEEQILTLVGSEIRAVRDRIIGRAELEGRKAVMTSRQELLSQVFETVEKRLIEIAEGKDQSVNYREILIKLIVEATSAIGGEEFLISANKRDLNYLKKNLSEIRKQVKDTIGGGNLMLDDEPIDIYSGVVVRNSDGTKTFHNTLEGRLVNSRGRVEAQVGKILEVI